MLFLVMSLLYCTQTKGEIFSNDKLKNYQYYYCTLICIYYCVFDIVINKMKTVY